MGIKLKDYIKDINDIFSEEDISRIKDYIKKYSISEEDCLVCSKGEKEFVEEE